METLLLLAVLGQVPAVQSIPDEATFELISIESRTRPDVLDATKLLVPASDDPSLLDTVYQNVNLYPFHLDYLRAEHPERFAGTTVEEYRRLVEIRATREYFAGTLQRIRSPDGEILYGFDIYTDVASEEELPLPGEIARVYEEVTATVALGPIVYSPLRTDVIEHVREWEETPFPIYLPDEGIIGVYAAYTRGIAYGTVRALDLATLVELDRTGEISARDIIIVDRPPTDLTSPVAAVITGAPQVELSHLALRLAQRRTPNAFDKALVEGAAPYEGKLVKIEVGSSTAEIRLVDDPAEAEEFWETHRPRLPSLPTFDLSERRIQTLDEIALDPHGGAKYGAKAANLGLLRTVLGPDEVVDGFAVPFVYYDELLDASPWNGNLSVSELIAGLEDDPTFRNDPVLRAIILRTLVDQIEDEGAIPDGLVDETIAMIETKFGGADRKVRFRSSSNLEDSVPFNGAGLYESTSGCAADSLDADRQGPSRCDPSEGDERTIERALLRVWASFWAPRAYNERDHWNVPWSVGRMGILVTEAFSDEIANGVVLTGDPATPGDDRIVINVQIGEESVVHPNPGVLPEKVIVEVEGGVATRVDRARQSTLLEKGEWILSVDEARWIAERVDEVRRTIGPKFETALGDILFDLELKVEEGPSGRRIVFKQLRPFLREPSEDVHTLAFVIPDGAEACGVFQEFRTLEEEYELLSTLRFSPGRLEIPGRPGSVRATLFDEIVVGPDRKIAASRGDGVFSIEVTINGGRRVHRVEHEETFDVDGEPLVVRLRFPNLIGDSSTTEPLSITFDEAFLSREMRLTGDLGSGAIKRRLNWASCSYDDLPRYEQVFTASSGERAVLDVRHLPPFVLTGPENLIGATLEIDGEARSQTDYWRLVYSADHHNDNRRFWVFLDPPIGLAHRAELREPANPGGGPPVFRLLDANGSIVRELSGVSMTRTRRSNPEHPEFLRGDGDSSASVDLSDAVHIARALFYSTAALACPDAADVNDDGSIDITDVVKLVLYLFGSDVVLHAIPAPGPDRCDRDPTEDDLPACEFDVGPCR